MRVWFPCLLAVAWLLATPAQGASPHTVPAAAAASARAKARAAARLFDSGAYDEARAAIEEGLAANPQDLSLLRLKGSLLMATQDLTGALAAYRAYLAAGATGAKKRQAEELVKELLPVTNTSLQVTVTNGPAQVFIPSLGKGVFCQAAPACPPAPVLPRSYQVAAERSGFQRWTGRVTVPNGEKATLTITLTELPSALAVHVTPESARVTVDGAAHDPEATIAPGHHLLAASADGYQPAKREIDAHAGQPVDVTLTMVPIPPPPPPPATVAETAPPPQVSGRHWVAAVVTGGVALAAGAAGLALGAQANSLNNQTYQLCPNADVPCANASDANDKNDQARTRALEANIAFGVAGGAAVAAAVLWFMGRPTAVAVTPTAGNGAAIGLAGSF